MTVPCLTYSQLKDYLARYDYIVVDPQPDFFDEHNRIIVSKGSEFFPLQYKDKYFYLHVVKICESLEIPVPEEHLHVYNQHMNMQKKHMEEIQKRTAAIQAAISTEPSEEKKKSEENDNS